MEEIEIEQLLESLKATLIRLGGIEIVASVEREAREAIPQLDTRAELLLLLDEIEGVLVDAPKMLQTTMRNLDAKSLAFVSDRSDPRFKGDVRRDRPVDAFDEGGEGVVITHPLLERWTENGSLASELIAGIRGRLDV